MFPKLDISGVGPDLHDGKDLRHRSIGRNRVTFNGASATFTIVSPAEITTSVPAGASFGRVKVATPAATLVSDVVFRVTK